MGFSYPPQKQLDSQSVCLPCLAGRPAVCLPGSVALGKHRQQLVVTDVHVFTEGGSSKDPKQCTSKASFHQRMQLAREQHEVEDIVGSKNKTAPS